MHIRLVLAGIALLVVGLVLNFRLIGGLIGVAIALIGFLITFVGLFAKPKPVVRGG